jgi:hypothetical protein
MSDTITAVSSKNRKLTSAPKVQTRLTTRVPLKSETGATISPKTVVVVTSTPEGKVRARTMGENPQFIVASLGAFSRRFRGRPRNDGAPIDLYRQAKTL